MVWGGISCEGKTDLHVFPNGTLTGESYEMKFLISMSNPTLEQSEKISFLWTIMLLFVHMVDILDTKT